MKILIVNKFLYPNGGSETYIFKLGDFLKQQGHEVEYFGMEHKDRCVGNRVKAYTSGMDFHNAGLLEKLTYPLKTIYSSEARKKIRLVLDDFQPDVVHLNNFNYQLTPSMILEIVEWRKINKKDCRIVITAHDYQLVCPNHMCNNPNTHQNCEKCLDGHFLNCTKGKCIHGSIVKSFIGTLEASFWKMNGVYKHIDKIICISQFEKNLIDRNLIFKDKTIKLLNFSEKFCSKDTEKKDYVLYFGRFSKEKGIGTLIQVAKELPKYKFIFAGTGPLECEIKDIQNIKNVGFQKGEALEKLIREAKLTVVPSEWYEPFGLAIVEAIAKGTPVLGANIGGIPELIEIGKTGDLFESGNKEEMKRKIKEMLLKSDEYRINCKNSNLDTIDVYYKKIMKIYRGE